MTRFQLILEIVNHDRTFELQDVQGKKLWVGKCIHCNSKIMVDPQGNLISATIEHIVPKNHNGTDELSNLTLACKQCNESKGYRLDNKNRNNAKLMEVIDRLQKRKAARQR